MHQPSVSNMPNVVLVQATMGTFDSRKVMQRCKEGTKVKVKTNNHDGELSFQASAHAKRIK